MKKAIPILLPIGIVLLLLFVAIAGDYTKEHIYHAWYAGRAPEHTVLSSPTSELQSKLDAQDYYGSWSGMGNAAGTYEWALGLYTVPIFRGENETVTLYYAFVNDGDVDLVIHSSFIPKVLGLQHLELAAKEKRYFRIDGVSAVRPESYLVEIDSGCSSLAVHSVMSSTDVIYTPVF